MTVQMGREVKRKICWFSAGAASAIATKLAMDETTVIARCITGSEHPDNDRFAKDCVRWFNQPIKELRSDKFNNTWEVWEHRKYLAGINGAPCTTELKVIPRLDFQTPDDIHVFGYTADGTDVQRAKRLREHFFELNIETPLIDRGITKAGCLAMLEGAGINPPVTYKIGFPNANCIPCVKATSPNYWALVRKHFPQEFQRMAELSRLLGARLARVGGERVFIDEIPDDQPTISPIMPSCDFLCAIAEQDL